MITIEHQKLNNGLPVFYIRNPGLTGVNLSLFIKVGSLDETKNNNGISHLVEHLLFSKRTSKGLNRFYPLNLQLEARTRKDITCFEISHHRDYLQEMADIIFQSICRPGFSAERVETEKEVVVQETKESRDEPFTFLEEEMDKYLYKDTSRELTILGTQKSLRKLDLETTKRWHFDHYHPDNMLLAVAGGFDLADARQKISGVFSQLKPSGEKGGQKKKPEHSISVRPGIFNIRKDGFGQTYIGLSFPSKGTIKGNDYYKLFLLKDLLGDQLQLVRDQEKDFYDIDIFVASDLYINEIRILTSTDKKRTDRLVKRLSEQICSLNISSHVFEKMKKEMVKRVLLKQDDIDDLSSLALLPLIGQKIYTPAQEAELISDIEFREIKQMQNEILNKDNCFMFRMSPAS
jgi:predicted Zn-dependent peptidase